MLLSIGFTVKKRVLKRQVAIELDKSSLATPKSSTSKKSIINHSKPFSNDNDHKNELPGNKLDIAKMKSDLILNDLSKKMKKSVLKRQEAIELDNNDKVSDSSSIKQEI